MSHIAWTWMIYVATHSNVAKYGEYSLDMIRKAPLGEQVRVLVQQETPEGCTRRDIGQTPELAQDMGATSDSGEPSTLLDFIRWAVERAPAERYALVLWSHGSGWEPSEMARLAQTQPAAVPVSTGELKQRDDDERRQVFFASSVRRLLSAPTPPERAIAADDGSGHSLDCVELGEVVAKAAALIGRPLDLLAMNACQMASVEVIYQCRAGASTYVASQEDMPAQSLPYAEILTELVAQPAMDGAALGTLIVERYCAFYRDNHSLPWGQNKFPAGVTLAAVCSANITQLTQAVSELATLLRETIDSDLDAIWAAHRAALAFKFRLYDLASFCRSLIAQPGISLATAEAAQRVLAVLADSSLVLANRQTAAKYTGVGGMTAYMMPPTPGKTLSAYYAETAFARDTGWGEFLAAYHNAAG